MADYDILGYFAIVFVLFVCAYIYYDNYGMFDLKCIVSTVDGNQYCVRDRNRLQEAADQLARITGKCKEIVSYMARQHPNRENVERIVSG